MSGRSCICVLEVSIFQLSTILIFDFGKVPTGWWCLLFILVCKVKKKIIIVIHVLYEVFYISLSIIIKTTFIDELITFTINPRYLQLIDSIENWSSCLFRSKYIAIYVSLIWLYILGILLHTSALLCYFSTFVSLILVII